MQALDAAASIVDDESASMSSCGRIEAVRAASLVLLLFCRDLGIPISVVGHTASSSQHTMELYCYADFEAIDDNDKYRLMDIQPRDCNRDGAAIRYAAERLLKRPERLKLLFVNSDGAPVACGYRGTAAEADLRAIKEEYTNKGITFIAAAIGGDRDTIERIYGDVFLNVGDLDALPYNLANILIRHLGL